MSVSVTSANSLTCAGVLCGRSGLSYWEVDQQNQQDARQQQLKAAQGRHGVLTRQLAGKSGQENKLQTGTKITLVYCSQWQKKQIVFRTGAAINCFLYFR